MASINHELKAIYIHIPKCGGLYVQKILEEFYGFYTIYNNKDLDDLNSDNFDDNWPILNQKKGIVDYIVNSDDKNLNIWNNYYKFTFVRNPYDKVISSYKYCFIQKKIKKDDFNDFIFKKDDVSDFEYFHTFITQKKHIGGNELRQNMNFIGKCENLDEELVNILISLGCKIKHEKYILNNLRLNNSSNFKFAINLNEDVIREINNIFDEDFNEYGYEKYNNLKELENYFEKKKINTDEKNKILINKLVLEKKIEDPYETITIGDDEIKMLKNDYNIDKYDKMLPVQLHKQKIINKSIFNGIVNMMKNINLDKTT